MKRYLKTAATFGSGDADQLSAKGALLPKTIVAAAISLAVLTGCSDNDDDDGMQMPVVDNGGMGGPVEGDFSVSQNDGTNPGSIKFFTGNLDAVPTTLNTGANEGIAFDGAGNVYQNADGSLEGIRVLGQALTRANASEYDASRDRMIGSAPGKGLTYIENGDLIVSADVTDSEADLKVYASTAGANAEPLFTIDTPAAPWDIFYEVDADRLYAALVDGTLAIFDEFSTDPTAIDRTVTPVDEMGEKVSVNFHGVFMSGDTLLVSDVGQASSPTDGALFTFSDDGSLDGETREFTRIAGPSSMLGNPVDVVLSGGSAVVAEKSNDQVLVFDAIASLNGDVAPSSSTMFVKPESVEFSVMPDDSIADASDIDSPTPLAEIAVSLNPGPAQVDGVNDVDNSNVGVIRLLGADLSSGRQFNAGAVEGVEGAQSFRTLENVQFDSAGNAYAIYENTDGESVSDKGIIVLHQLAQREEIGFNANRDRFIGGTGSMLTSPKGIEVVESLGMLIVADVGNDGTPASLQVYSTAAGDSVTPLFSVANTGTGAIWDVDYDVENDRLYAAGTKGDILVYDNFMMSAASAMPTRSIQASTAAMPSNMHGIVYVASTDQLIATDVGDAASATDGKLYVIDNAMTANGSVMPALTISGDASQLGNPVDLAFDGSSAYIAEKSNNALLVFDNILDLEGTISVSADSSVDLPRPESVSLKAQ